MFAHKGLFLIVSMITKMIIIKEYNLKDFKTILYNTLFFLSK